MDVHVHCTICLGYFNLCEVSALRCGHTFHLACISQWLENYATCPECRQRTTQRDLVKQLYFHPGEGPSNSSVDETAAHYLRLQLEQALVELRDQRDKSEQISKEFAACRTEKLALVEQMAETLQRHRFVENELEVCRKRLEASDFYKLLSSAKDHPVSEIDKYIGNSGLEVEKFLVILKRQLNEASKTIVNQNQELDAARNKITELQKKLNEHKKLNVALQRELASTRTDPSQTIMNPALEEIVAYSPERRSGADAFIDHGEVYPASLMASAYRTGSARTTAARKNVGEVSPVRTEIKLNFMNEAESFYEKAVKKNRVEANDIDDMEEVFVPPAVRKFAARPSSNPVIHISTRTKRKQMPKKAEMSTSVEINMVYNQEKRPKNAQPIMKSRGTDLSDDSVIIIE